MEKGLFEYLLRLVEEDVGEREAVDLYDLVAHGEAAVAVDAASGLDALHHEAPVVVAGDHVNAEGTCIGRENHISSTLVNQVNEATGRVNF